MITVGSLGTWGAPVTLALVVLLLTKEILAASGKETPKIRWLMICLIVPLLFVFATQILLAMLAAK